jgi:hypothetical protein
MNSELAIWKEMKDIPLEWLPAFQAVLCNVF